MASSIMRSLLWKLCANWGHGDGMENKMVGIDMDKKKVVVGPQDFGHGMIGHDLTNA